MTQWLVLLTQWLVVMTQWLVVMTQWLVVMTQCLVQENLNKERKRRTQQRQMTNKYQSALDVAEGKSNAAVMKYLKGIFTRMTKGDLGVKFFNWKTACQGQSASMTGAIYMQPHFAGLTTQLACSAL